MIFSGLELMGDVPFKDVVIHSLVHAPTGGRMSKSLGTGMNPLALIEKYGADATRYGLMKMASSQDVRVLRGRDRGGAEAREQAVERRPPDPAWRRRAPSRPSGRRRSRSGGSLPVSRRPSARIEGYLGEFDFAHLVGELYHLTFDDFCDWYAEAIKPRL